jgi:F420-non-reducing hydrogenase small subunit
MDFKFDDFASMPNGSVDIGLFNGAVRTSEQRDQAEIFRSKCKVLVAYGSCACFGGIPGLANLANRDEIFEEAYQSTPSTENPDELRPSTAHDADGHELELPEFFDEVYSLNQVVSVDVSLPGCPPPNERILDLFGVAASYAETGSVPPAGTVIASEKALCDTCPRNETRSGGRIAEVKRPHEMVADSEKCFLDQGILCMGIATRGGCEHTCIDANMPCRGCFGPTPDMLDPGAEAISAIGSVAGASDENDVPAHIMKKAVRSVRDPVGTFYRFTLPNAFLNRAVKDEPKEEQTS